jgi:hypothetical protein
MDIEEFLIICLHCIVIFLLSMFVFFMGYRHGLKDMEKEAVQKHFGHFDIDSNSHIVFKWNDLI